MYTEEFYNKLQAALEQEENLDKLAAAGTVEEFKAVLAELGMDLADEDAAAVMAKLEECRSSGELAEEDLENVSGGLITEIVLGTVYIGSLIITTVIVYKVGKWIIDKKYSKRK